MKRILAFAALAALLGALPGCRTRTFVLVTVDADPQLAPSIDEIRFVSRLSREGSELVTDERRVAPPSPFPGTFIVLADDRGGSGDTVEVLIEGLDASGAVIARGRTTAPIIENDESTAQVLLSSPCVGVDDCFAGGTFCANPVRCDCEGPDCAEGFCLAVPVDDGNPCTERECNEEARVVTQAPLPDGTECDNDAGQLACVSGVCGCGDGATSPDIEQCDEGENNANEPNRCRAAPACSLPFCGDGIVDDRAPFFEECDDGENNRLAPDACRPDCKLPACGDFIVDSGEECDEGIGNDDTTPLACRTTCRAPSCGDGVIDVGFAFGQSLEEECDDGAGNTDTDVDGCRQEIGLENGTGATVQCKLAFCGDGVVDTGERCDDNNSANGDGCNPTCSLFGEVSLVAGASGGRGVNDGVGTDARLFDSFHVEVIGDKAYFTMDRNGGTVHVVRSVEISTGQVETLAGRADTPGTADGTGDAARFTFPQGLASQGNTLFIADNTDRVRALDVTTGAVTTVVGPGATGALANANLVNPRHIEVVGQNRLVVLESGPVRCRLILFDLAAQTERAIAGGSGDFCVPFDGSTTTSPAGFYSDFVGGMTLGSDGALYVTDSNAVRRQSLTSPFAVTTISGAFNSTGSNDGALASARYGPLGDIEADGTLLTVADINNGLRTLDLGASTVTTEIPTPTVTQPRALGAAGGRVFVVSEQTRGRLVTANLTTDTVVPLAGQAERRGFEDGVGEAARFFFPTGLSIVPGADPDTVWVADLGNNRVRAVSKTTGAVTTPPSFVPASNAFDIAGFGGRVFALLQSGIGAIIRELDPQTGARVGTEIPVFASRSFTILDGFAYLAAPDQQVIYRADLSTGDVVIFAGQDGDIGLADGPVDVALFSAPEGIATCNGDLYIVESNLVSGPNLVRKIDLSATPPEVSTLAGSPGLAVTRDGTGSRAAFNDPAAVACDGESLYVAERSGHTIRQIELATGRVTTLIGVPDQAAVADGIGVEARANAPAGVAFDPTTGDLYITDREENVVRKIQ